MPALRNVLVAACFTIAPGLAGAQQAASTHPVADALHDAFKEAQDNLVAAVQAFPADKFGYKPTPAQMTVGEIGLHLASGNTFLCATISGKPRPQWPKLEPTAPKDSIVARLKASFDWCGTVLAGVDDSKLGEMVPWFGPQPVTRATAIVGIAQDWADHYSQLANYLRLNGLLPPTAGKKE